MTEEKLRKKFPSYFENFEIPKWAEEQELLVYRACRTGEVDRGSFLNSYEEAGFKISMGADKADPKQYSLSTYLKFKDTKRFMTMTNEYGKPFVIAKGITEPMFGPCLIDKIWNAKRRENGEKIKKSKNSHVNWWLYEDATPWECFEVVRVDENGKIIE